MSSTTARKVGENGTLGTMVRTPTEIHVYWHPASSLASEPLTLRISDQTGRHADQLLDGCGMREMAAERTVYVTRLLPGHLYVAEVGRSGPGGFTPLVTAGPVQTPWQATSDLVAEYPAPYHRS